VNAIWQRKTTGGVEYFEFSPTPRLLLAFFTRSGGVSRGDYESLNTSFDVGDDERDVEENFARVRRSLLLPTIVTVRQTHSDTVLQVADEQTPIENVEGDACCTDRSALGLGLRVADCLPVYIYAADSSCIGIAHCGWRGTATRIAEKTARQMSHLFSVPLPDLRFAFGPCVCSDCYDVGDDVYQEFTRNFPQPGKFFSPIRQTATRTVGLHAELSPRYRLDIVAANRWLLTETGMSEAASISLCTLENESLFYSARRSRTTGRNLAVIALR
jgi:YfiH family protein